MIVQRSIGARSRIDITCGFTGGAAPLQGGRAVGPLIECNSSPPPPSLEVRISVDRGRRG